MGLFDAIKGMFSSDAAEPGYQMIVDGRAMLGGRADFRPTPRDMIALLYRLGRFMEQEKLRAAVVFEGEPLHKAGDGDQFQGVTVYYAEGASRRGARLLELGRASARKGAVTLVSDDPSVEAEAAAGGLGTLRASTLLRAIESAGGERQRPPDHNGGRRGRREGRRGRSRRGGGPPPSGQLQSAAQTPSAGEGTGAAPPAPSSAAAGSDEAVRRMVDLVDE